MKRISFLFATWSGRIIVLNSIVFLIMSWQSGSIFLPAPDVLLAWGAKDPVLFVRGEYWRIFTPMFVHIGMLHFMLNMWAVYVLSDHIERSLGGAVYLLIYVGSGLLGNIFSLVFSLAVSAGASSSVFGIMGSGFFLEFLAGRRMAKLTGQPAPKNVYKSLLITNIVLGFLIPQIDNSAHLGGLVAGVIITYAILCIRLNPVVPRRPWTSVAIFMFLGALMTGGVFRSLDEHRLFKRFFECGESADTGMKQYHCYTEALRLMPFSLDTRLRRAVVLIKAKEFEAAKDDIAIVASDPNGQARLATLKTELISANLTDLVPWIDKLMPQ